MNTALRDRLLRLYDEVDLAILVISSDKGKILFFNQHVCNNMQMDRKSIQGQSYTRVFEPDFATFYAGLVAECTDGLVHTKVFFWENKMIWEQVAAQRIEWLTGRPAILLSITNITDVSRSEYEYKQMAYYDRLLSLPNERKLELDISSMHSFERSALIHFDINRFESVIELYGWVAGDELLIQIRDWLFLTLRNTSKLYRMNDNGFCLLILDISLESAKDRAKEIVRRFSKPWKVHYDANLMSVYCALKMGIVYGKYIRGDMRNILYRTIHAPGQKKTGYTLYDEKMDEELQNKAHLRYALTNCIKEKMRGFEVYYQPIVDAKDGKWVGAEALCRWVSPSGEFVQPDIFIPEVENLELIGELDNWVCEKAMTQCMEWGLHRRCFFLDVNMSPLQLVDNEFVEGFLDIPARLGYPKRKLTLEITESAKMNFSKENMAGLCQLRDEGVTLALDDFGTGYSSFENLAKIPASVLKIESSFVQPLERDPYFQHLTRVLVDFGHTMGMTLITEGVETERQRDLLKSYNVDYLQGFLYAKPLSSQLFSEQLHKFKE